MKLVDALGVEHRPVARTETPRIVSLVPSIMLGILVQRHLVRGLTLGAVRG